jgi:hypothetical protein
VVRRFCRINRGRAASRAASSARAGKILSLAKRARLFNCGCTAWSSRQMGLPVGARYRRFWLGGERRARDKNEPAWCSLRGNCARLQSQSQLSRSQCTRAAIPCWCRRKASRLDLVLTSLPIISLSNVKSQLFCSVRSCWPSPSRPRTAGASLVK